jgi:Exostosin family
MMCYVKLLLVSMGACVLISNYYALLMSGLEAHLGRLVHFEDGGPTYLRAATSRIGVVSTSMDYPAFWKEAAQEAIANSKLLMAPSSGTVQSDVATDPPPCPKVYMYNLSSAFQDTNLTKVEDYKWVFGPGTPGWNGTLRQTRQHHLGVIFQHRLMQPDNCYITDDPEKADLFFVPLLLEGKKVGEWTSSCESMDVSKLIPELTFLTPETACKHFFVFPKGHYAGENCKGWFFDPLPMFNNTMRLSYSHLPGKADETLTNYLGRSETPEQDSLRHPNLISVPYPSSLHWHANYTSPMPWMDVTSQQGQRKYLMSFVGRFDHGDVPVRQQIQKMCEGYDDPLKCIIPSSSPFRGSSLPSEEILVKQESVFCLEPGGDSPWRKSLSDSITFGCIPVLFSEDSDDVSPWHWGHWKKQGRVLIDREAFANGEIDLYELLGSIPSDLLLLMQGTLERHAHQFQYSLHEDRNDGFHLALEGMKQYSLGMKEQGQC